MLKKHSFDFVRDTASAFRLLMDCFANPGKENRLGQYFGKFDSENPGLLLIAVILLDNEVSFEIEGDKDVAREISELTGCERKESDKADYIFVSEPLSSREKQTLLESCRHGSFESPNESATIVIGCNSDERELISLKSPCLNEMNRVSAPKEAADWLRKIRDRNFEYPQGVDMIIISETGTCFCVPRLIKAVN
ncbi:MAG: phosphonate C-P lyase system protein PhnH [Clostridiales Family XIII bacterium]|jgi:alpha-D-ribose 1-methylphosphonate 5-triphosphate synthase subunit PhnH|nr:phosphonate C-P lyase system protein PhnH [Clostridiales Family XIII bacterium]